MSSLQVCVVESDLEPVNQQECIIQSFNCEGGSEWSKCTSEKPGARVQKQGTRGEQGTQVRVAYRTKLWECSLIQ